MEYNFDNERPIYIQLVELIRTMIVSGKFKQGERLPSVRELALTVNYPSPKGNGLVTAQS